MSGIIRIVRITNMEVKSIPVLENERGFGTR